MQIDVYSLSETRATLIERAIRFYSKYLGIDRIKSSMFVRCRQGMRSKENLRGSISQYSSCNFVMHIDNKLPLHILLSTLAHEMVHAKQFIRGEIKLLKYRNGRTKYIWKGKESRVSYEKQPWEEEAVSMEVPMVNALMAEVHKNARKTK